MNMTVENAMHIIDCATDNVCNSECYDLKTDLEWLQRAIKENPNELIKEIDKSIEILNEQMLDANICPNCGGDLYNDKEGDWVCERCETICK